jgi:hypothetical protein
MNRIEKISIPDDDMVEWITALREAHFTDEEMHSVLAYLNATYVGLQEKHEVVQEVQKLDEHLKTVYGRGLTQEQREFFLKKIEELETRKES